MFNLIKNELYKIFHKKGIYIVLIITVLYSILTNFIYSTDLVSSSFIEDDYKTEVSYAETLEKLGEEDSEEYLYSKTFIATYKYAKSFGEDSWQRYIISNDMEYNSKAYDIMERITSYELKRSSDKEKYEEALKEKEELTNELKNIDWKEFINKEKEKIEAYLKDASEEEKYTYLAQLETLNMRLDKNIKYEFNDINTYLDNYEYNRSIELSYEGIDEDSLKQEDKTILQDAKKEVEISKYKIENNIEEVPYNSTHYVYTSFYSEYFIMILVLIVLVSGSIVSEEFSKGTIKLLLVKPFSRIKILMSKYLTTLLMVIFAIISTFIIQTIVGGLFFGFDSLEIPTIIYNYTTESIEVMHVLKYFLLNTISVLPQFILISTLAFSLSTIFINTSIATTLTVVGAFGSDIINVIAQSFEIEILKFFVTLNWDWSVYLFGGSSPYKGVTFPLSVIVCIVYLLIMLVTSIIVFNKRNIKNI